MTTREQIIAAAKETGITYSGAMPEIFNSQDMLDKFYTIAFNAGGDELRKQLAEALLACKVKDEIIEKFRRAIGDHCAPNDCYATGPLTGNDFLDLVQCPACSAIAAYEEALERNGT